MGTVAIEPFYLTDALRIVLFCVVNVPL